MTDPLARLLADPADPADASLGRAAVVAAQGRVVGEVGPADRPHQAPEDRVAVARDDDVAAILGRVGVRGRDARQGAARPGADLAEEVVDAGRLQLGL